MLLVTVSFFQCVAELGKVGKTAYSRFFIVKLRVKACEFLVNVGELRVVLYLAAGFFNILIHH